MAAPCGEGRRKFALWFPEQGRALRDHVKETPQVGLRAAELELL